MYNARGLTLIELLITITILAIILSIAIPGFQSQVEASRTRSAADQLYQAMQLTRNKAIASNRRATMRKLGSWESGWEIFYDQDFDGKRDGSEEKIATGTALTGISIGFNSPLEHYVSYIGSGEPRMAGAVASGSIQAGTFTVCSVNTDSTIEGYALTLSPSGRVRQRRIAAEDC